MPRPPESPLRPPVASRQRSRRPLAALLAVLGVLVLVSLAAPFRSAETRLAPAVGPTTVTPTVIGRPVGDAGAALIAAGFRSPVSWRSDPAAAGSPCTVVRQVPPAGAAFQAGAQATLVIVRGSCR